VNYKIIRLEIPEHYYQTLEALESYSDNKEFDGLPITEEWLYGKYRTIMDSITAWLWDQMVAAGYGTVAEAQGFDIIGHENQKVTLQKTDNETEDFWPDKILRKISDQFGFGKLLDQWNQGR